ncbi:MAG: hypothetical protein P8P13_04730 [Flavobacteriaceae bacterium]|mgnify:FL=1|jgi:hypothetical protein|nr:hypothetical protein [Flavobacteriaceae bacterium]|tara:strand:+ start:235 stop:360 length:126 start_codon:yes stop_codon:yes gene_type:complete
MEIGIRIGKTQGKGFQQRSKEPNHIEKNLLLKTKEKEIKKN